MRMRGCRYDSVNGPLVATPDTSSCHYGVSVPSDDDQQQPDMAAARAIWEDIARRAHSVHCPEHFVAPWRVVVIGDTPDRLRLQIYGCCEKLQLVVTDLIKADPRVSRPS